MITTYKPISTYGVHSFPSFAKQKLSDHFRYEYRKEKYRKILLNIGIMEVFAYKLELWKFLLE